VQELAEGETIELVGTTITPIRLAETTSMRSSSRATACAC